MSLKTNNSQPTADERSKNNRKLFFIILAAIGILIFFVILGKFYDIQSTKQALENSGVNVQKMDLDENNFEFTVTDDQGNTVEMKMDLEGQEIPEKLKNNVPIFEAAKLITSSDSQDYGISGTFETTEKVETVKNFYLNELEGDGWRKVSELNLEGSVIISLTKDNKTISVSIITEEDKTQFSITYLQ